MGIQNNSVIMIKRISIFFEHFELLHESKDIGQIILGLIDVGIGAELITKDKDCLAEYQPSFPIIRAKSSDLISVNFWKNLESNVVVFYHGLRHYKKHFQAIKAAQKKIIVKLDSDGQLWYPLHYFPSQRFRHTSGLLRRLGRIIKWSIPFWRRAIVQADLRQLEMADAVIIESPEALNNLIYLYNYWAKPELAAKTYVVPNPVEPLFLDASTVSEKDNIIVSVGRWDFQEAKNPKLLVKTLVNFLHSKKDYQAKIVGSGENIIRKLLNGHGNDISDRVEILGHLTHDQLLHHLRTAKIFFMPSRWESFGMAAAEAICCGCSIVGTPLETLKYLSMQGFSGVTAANFSKKAVLAALLLSAEKWERKEYDPEEIANFWRKKLDRKNIAKEFVKIAEKI